MRIISIRKAIQKSLLPSGETVFAVDAYDGCEIACPYCYQWEDPSWSRVVAVKTNIADALSKEVEQLPQHSIVYLGDRSDPYMLMEKRFQLTRRILQVLCLSRVETVLISKSHNGTIMRDIDIFREFGERLTICIGLSHLVPNRHRVASRLRDMARIANRLKADGLRTVAFLAPFLPGITEIEEVLLALDETTPLAVDGLWVNKGGRAAARTLSYVRAWWPELMPMYEGIMENGPESQMSRLRQQYRGNHRVGFLRSAIGGETRVLSGLIPQAEKQPHKKGQWREG
jgi:DNA repair photolyase